MANSPVVSPVLSVSPPPCKDERFSVGMEEWTDSASKSPPSRSPTRPVTRTRQPVVTPACKLPVFLVIAEKGVGHAIYGRTVCRRGEVAQRGVGVSILKLKDQGNRLCKIYFSSKFGYFTRECFSVE